MKGLAMSGFLKEFRDFAVKGNMIDLAIGVIIGAAFGAIVSSIVDDLFMPLIGILIGGIDFSGIVLQVGEARVNIGLFINALVKFTIVAFVLFLVVKGINSLKREAAKEPVETTPAPTKEEILLTEIRDTLRAQSKA